MYLGYLSFFLIIQGLGKTFLLSLVGFLKALYLFQALLMGKIFGRFQTRMIQKWTLFSRQSHARSSYGSPTVILFNAKVNIKGKKRFKLIFFF